MVEMDAFVCVVAGFRRLHHCKTPRLNIIDMITLDYPTVFDLMIHDHVCLWETLLPCPGCLPFFPRPRSSTHVQRVQSRRGYVSSCACPARSKSRRARILSILSPGVLPISLVLSLFSIGLGHTWPITGCCCLFVCLF